MGLLGGFLWGVELSRQFTCHGADAPAPVCFALSEGSGGSVGRNSRKNRQPDPQAVHWGADSGGPQDFSCPSPLAFRPLRDR